jgi:hypothetical protein
MSKIKRSTTTPNLCRRNISDCLKEHEFVLDNGIVSNGIKAQRASLSLAKSLFCNSEGVTFSGGKIWMHG